jgi:hypothetical protein
LTARSPYATHHAIERPEDGPELVGAMGGQTQPEVS